MSNRTYICVACRTSARREARYGVNFDSVRCPECQSEMWSLCWRWRIPQKSDDKGWRDLAAKVADEGTTREEYAEHLTAKIDELNRKITEADQIRDDAKRKRKLKALNGQVHRTEHARSLIKAESKQAEQARVGKPHPL